MRLSSLFLGGATLGGLWLYVKEGRAATAPSGGVRHEFMPSQGGGDGGKAFGDAMPEQGDAREEYILDAVRNGHGIFEWGEVVSTANGHTARIPVMRKALAIGVPGDSLRVSVKFPTAQRIADEIGATMLTPHVSNLIAKQASVKPAPRPQQAWVADDTMAKTKRLKEYDAIIDSVVPADAQGLIANEGKNWVITKRNWTDPDLNKRHNGANHGWYISSGKGLIQDRGLVHNLDHVDYSQLLVLMAPIIEVDGQPMHVANVLGSPEFAPLLSDEGTLPGARHPDL